MTNPYTSQIFTQFTLIFVSILLIVSTYLFTVERDKVEDLEWQVDELVEDLDQCISKVVK